MTTGIISGLGRPIQESTNVIIRNMIQTDAAINLCVAICLQQSLHLKHNLTTAMIKGHFFGHLVPE